MKELERFTPCSSPVLYLIQSNHMHSSIEEVRQRCADEADLYKGLCLDEERYEMGKRDASRAAATTLVSETMWKDPSYRSGYTEVMGELQPAFVTKDAPLIEDEF